MTALRILDRLSAPGHDDRPNEDRLGVTERAAFVIDGATGLADAEVMDAEGSDAAWFAALAARRLGAALEGRCDLAAEVAALAEEAHAAFLAHAPEAPRYAWPCASFAAVEATAEEVTVSGLGDCLVYLHDGGGAAVRFSPLPQARAAERREAERHVARGGLAGAASPTKSAATLAELRGRRGLQNTPRGSWLLGLAPDAGAHLASRTVPGRWRGLVMTDGFAELAETYGRYTPASLVAAAETAGLAALMAELRHLERELDPDGRRYARFKQSDDASAVLFASA